MNVNLKGVTKQILVKMIEKGYSNTQSEAIRMTINWFAREHFNENELAAEKMKELHNSIKKGKLKTYSLKETIKKYPELKELA